MSIATVVTMGYGTFGSVNKLPTLGYSIGAPVVLVYGPGIVGAAAVYVPGAKKAAVYQPGAFAAGVYQPGAKAGTVQ